MSLTPPAGPFNLGNTLYVNQEVAPDRVPLYSQLVDSYKWMEKVNHLKKAFFAILHDLFIMLISKKLIFHYLCSVV